MFKLLPPSNPWCRTGISRVFRVLFFSSETLTSSASSDSFQRRIWPVGILRESIVPVLDQWINEGRSVKQQEIQRIIRQLRSFSRFKDALEISEWMTNRINLDLSHGDVATRLDLISKVHGLEQAEKYFDSIPDSRRVFHVYGALLNCYAHNKSLKKAEGLMQKMRELGFFKTTLSYNVMLNLYSQIGKYEKLDTLMQEMKENGIRRDRFTFSIRLNAYVSTSDVEGMEKFVMNMEADPLVTMDWHAYVVAANGYLKAGLTEKTLAALKKSEQLISGKSKKIGYQILLTLYSALGNKDEVYRIWNLCENLGSSYNASYLCMISSLMKLDDIDGAEKILKQWESGNTCYDLRIPNFMIIAYSKRGLLGKAEAIINRLVERGKKPNSSTWDRLATGYHMDNQMAKAVEAMKKAILASQPGWKPNISTLAACLEFLKGKGDVQGAEQFRRLLGEQAHFSKDTDERLANYREDVNPGSIALDQMGGDEAAQEKAI